MRQSSYSDVRSLECWPGPSSSKHKPPRACCCLQEVFSGEPLRAVEQLRRTDVIPPALLSDYQKLLSSQVGRRLNPAKVCEEAELEVGM